MEKKKLEALKVYLKWIIWLNNELSFTHLSSIHNLQSQYTQYCSSFNTTLSYKIQF